ncbi:MAG: NfeD family protein, partial [Armatimonadetes bacterium]|nr:NfeD family protein [Armatimonadota bacterium]
VQWLVAAIILLIVEVFTGTFVILWIGIAAFLAGIAAAFAEGPMVPWISFILASALLLWFTRPLVHTLRDRLPTRTNVDALVNQYAIVIETIDPGANTGRVRVGSDEWRARSSEVIEAGTWVRVKEVSGTTLIVEP